MKSNSHSRYTESTTELVNAIARRLASYYVFPETAERVGIELQKHLAAGRYGETHDAQALLDLINADIFAVANDKHIRLRYSATPTVAPDRQKESAQAEQIYRARCLDSNFGVERVERLPLNIGYIELRGFMRTDLAGDAVVAAMALVAHTEALIFDLRRNGGGYSQTVALVCSYLFDEPTHLNSIYLREDGKTQQFWTHPWVPGRKFGKNKPVCVLVSPATFSAAEEFAYNLKNLKRATIVGEQTRGGAHPGEFHWLNPHFSLFVPGGRAINPVTLSNWESIGVEPDVKVPEADALQSAQRLLLSQIHAQSPSAERKSEISDRIRELEAT